MLLFVGAFGNAALAAVVPVMIGVAFNAVIQNPPNFAAVGRAAAWIIVSQIARGVLQP